MTTTMHDPQPRVETPTLEDRPSTSGICTTCGFWPCQCADMAWVNALATLTDPDDEILAATRTDMLTTYGRLVLGTELDNAGLDAVGDMVDVGLIRPEDLAVPAPAADLLLAADAWIGEDIETEDDQDGYEPEDLTSLARPHPRVMPLTLGKKADLKCHCGTSVVRGSACQSCGCTAGGPKQCDR
ncbi:hypothetical protein SAMN06297387_12846 [Streptomyces zhaozhouensis]|uniref:Uncharacterized protein n=1 Tax=Streptomyces zhaozhouensis TaxID=1300267 RepID=A0A286E819_9ACTN|nr:hypothetical protein [Streptomyces zhaozhouensis]SOD67052.1 hypothetical protein SAMN06297387_12846 [Streptomyces zhaozhouensis]